MADRAAADRSPEIQQPTRDPITYRGRTLTPGMILDLWKQAQALKQESRKRILECREYRRMAETTLIQLSTKWSRLFPEAANWVQEVLEERVTLDANMVARVGVVEPEFSVAPIATANLDPFSQTAHALAEAREAYLEEWRKRSVPTQVFFGKGTEDGEYARVTLPSDLDWDGMPDFFETLDQRAYDAADEHERAQYTEDTNPARPASKKRYVKQDASGAPVVKSKYQPKPLTDSERKLHPEAQQKVRDAREQASRDAHLDDVRRYLLDKDATTTRVISALDCAPIFTRGKGRSRWELSALVERSLYYVDELQEMTYGWKGMGDRLLVPLAYDADGTRMSVAPGDVGQQGQLYLYTAYLVCRDADGHRRPLLAYTVGGASTTLGGATEPDDTEQVGLIDLFEAYGLEGPLWSYHGGLHSEDDDPDHYWRPYIHAFLKRIRGIEGNKTAMNAATQASSFPGQYFRPDAAIAALEKGDEFLFGDDGELTRPQIARTGELLPAVGEIFNAPPPGIGPDAWRQLQADLASLRAATSPDQPQADASTAGSALSAQVVIGQTAKRHIREGALDAVVRSGEDHLKILDAIHRKHGVKWPLQTVDERPVGDETHEGVAIAEYDPRWLGEGMTNLKAEYPEEENLARIDLEAKLYAMGLGSSERVYRALGEKDTDRARMNAERDQLMKEPAITAMRVMRVAKKIGDKELYRIAHLQAQKLMAKQPVPGMQGGIPTASLNRPGDASGDDPNQPGSSSMIVTKERERLYVEKAYVLACDTCRSEADGFVMEEWMATIPAGWIELHQYGDQPGGIKRDALVCSWSCAVGYAAGQQP